MRIPPTFKGVVITPKKAKLPVSMELFGYPKVKEGEKNNAYFFANSSNGAYKQSTFESYLKDKGSNYGVIKCDNTNFNVLRKDQVDGVHLQIFNEYA